MTLTIDMCVILIPQFFGEGPELRWFLNLKKVEIWPICDYDRYYILFIPNNAQNTDYLKYFEPKVVWI